MTGAPPGLVNLGNTCYMNSCLQVLACTDTLYDAISRRPISSNPVYAKVLTEFYNLQRNMRTETQIINPISFVQAVMGLAKHKQFQEFQGFDQSDASEFLIFLMDAIHSATRYKVLMSIDGTSVNFIDEIAHECYDSFRKSYETDYSDIVKIFYCMQIEILRDPDSQSILSKNYSSSSIINLPVVSSDHGRLTTINDCFLQLCRNERLSGDNMWFNEATKQMQPVDRQCMFWSLPQTLIVCLLRFSNQHKKFVHNVEVPLDNLDLSAYVCGYRRNSFVYDLYGVSNHSGVLSGGHYTCNVLRNGAWWSISDGDVRKIPRENVINPNAYCLFFRKKSAQL